LRILSVAQKLPKNWQWDRKWAVVHSLAINYPKLIFFHHFRELICQSLFEIYQKRIIF
jgi:hypothetical protein